MPTDTLDIWRTAAESAWDLEPDSALVPADTEASTAEHTADSSDSVDQAPDLAEADTLVNPLPHATEPDGGDRYLDRGPLSRGGMGEVRLVWDRRLGRMLAQKILSAQTSRTS